MEFAKTFKKLRRDRGLSQSELAGRLGISKSAVNMYERGERRPDLEMIKRIADFFNVDLNYLLGFTDKVAGLSGDQTDSIPGVRMNTIELEVLKSYRHAGAETQAAIRAILHI